MTLLLAVIASTVPAATTVGEPYWERIGGCTHGHDYRPSEASARRGCC